MIEDKELEIIADMLNSNQEELQNLARNLFWGLNPEREDYERLSTFRGFPNKFVPEPFERTRKHAIREFCGEETYNTIYGEGNTSKSEGNVERE